MYGFIIGGDISNYKCPYCGEYMIWHEYGKDEDTKLDTVCENNECKGNNNEYNARYSKRQNEGKFKNKQKT